MLCWFISLSPFSPTCTHIPTCLSSGNCLPGNKKFLLAAIQLCVFMPSYCLVHMNRTTNTHGNLTKGSAWTTEWGGLAVTHCSGFLVSTRLSFVFPQVCYHNGNSMDPNKPDQLSQASDDIQILEEFVSKYLPGLDPKPAVQERCIYTVKKQRAGKDSFYGVGVSIVGWLPHGIQWGASCCKPLTSQLIVLHNWGQKAPILPSHPGGFLESSEQPTMICVKVGCCTVGPSMRPTKADALGDRLVWEPPPHHTMFVVSPPTPQI